MLPNIISQISVRIAMLSKLLSIAQTKPAEIEYHGQSSTTGSCLNAIVCLHHARSQIQLVRLLTASNRHGFLVSFSNGRVVAIKAGFTSGYQGEGPRGLAAALRYFHRISVDLRECSVSSTLLDRLNASAMTSADLNSIECAPVISGGRYFDYMHHYELDPQEADAEFQGLFGFDLPMRIVDPRIFDLALSFPVNSDGALLDGYRRLEGILRLHCGLEHGHGINLVKKVFVDEDCALTWRGCNKNERYGRADLFVGTFKAFRNSRAHNERNQSDDEYIREFLLLNELFRLESLAEPRLESTN